MSAEDKLRHILKDEFRRQVLVAAMPEFIALVELALEEIDAQRKRQNDAKAYMQQQLALHTSRLKHQESAKEIWERMKREEEEERRNRAIKSKSFWGRFAP